MSPCDGDSHVTSVRRLLQPVRVLVAFASLACATQARATDDGVWGTFIPGGLPCSEDFASAVDAANRRIYLFGPRLTAEFGANNNETYVLDMGVAPARFTRLSTVAPPPPRIGSVLVF